MHSSGSQRRYAEHYELLAEAVAECFCPTSCLLVKTLCNHGPLTLREAADAVRGERFLSAPSFAVPSSTASLSGLEDGAKSAKLLEDLFSANSAATQQALVREATQVGTNQHPKDVVMIASDVEIRKAAILLAQHGVLEYSEVEKTYRVRLGYGLLHCVLFPVILNHVKQLHGVAGEKLMELLHVFGVLPCNALLTLATQQAPSLHSAFASALGELRASCYISPLAELGETSAGPDAKRHRSELSPLTRPSATTGGFVTAAAGDITLTVPCAINYSAVLHKLRQDAILRMVQARIVDDTAAKICSVIFAQDTPASHFQRGSANGAPPDLADGFPYRAEMSKSVSLPALRVSCDGLPVGETPLLAVLSKLAMPGPTIDGCPGRALLARASSSASSGPVDYRVSYLRAGEILRGEQCEQCIFSRHGVLGVRIVRRLLTVHMLDDRAIAEQCIATLTQTREVLCALMRDGVVRQQEVPMVASLERPPRLSQFLWALERDQLENVVSLHLVKALRHARLRLAYELKRRQKSCVEGTDGTAANRARQQQDVAERALESSISAIINGVIVMDYF
jgi:hypothetical protein